VLEPHGGQRFDRIGGGLLVDEAIGDEGSRFAVVIGELGDRDA